MAQALDGVDVVVHFAARVGVGQSMYEIDEYTAVNSRGTASLLQRGVLAIFAGRLLNERPPLIFEDGDQRRDFVSVHDVVRACTLATRSAA